MTPAAAPPPMTYPLLWATAILAVLTIVLVVVAVRAGLFKPAKPAPPPGDAAKPGPVEKVTRAIGEAMQEVRRLVSGGDGPEDAPWVMVLGAGGDALRALLPPVLVDAPGAITWLDPSVKGLAGGVSFHESGVVVGFADGLIGGDGWRAPLISLLRALDLKKPGRPIDALVVVLPCEALTDADKLAQIGARTYEVILTIQQRTGWRVPIHVLATGCDALPGFAAWRQASAALGGDQILGWPVPYALDTVFDARWIEEAFDSMVRLLAEQTCYLLMRRDGGVAPHDSRTAEEIFLFSTYLREVQAGLTAFLTAVLHKSAYHEQFMLRGMYLIGGPEAAAAPAASGVAAGTAGLFIERIFAEHRLAQPAYGEMTRRHRAIRVTQWVLAGLAALLLVGLAGLVRFGHDQIPKVQDLLCGVWVEVPGATLNTRGCGRVNASDVLENGRDKRAIDLLRFMAAIDSDSVDTPLAPTSYLTDVNRKVIRAVNKGYKLTVFAALSDAMTTQAGLQALLSRGANIGDLEQTWFTTVDNFQEYSLNYEYAVSLKTGEMTSNKMQQFMSLIKYVFNVQLPASFAENYKLYGVGLEKSTIKGLESNATRQVLTGILKANFDGAVCSVYTGNPIIEAYAHPGSNGCAARPATVPGGARPIALADDPAPNPVEPSLEEIEPYSPINFLDRLKTIVQELAIKGRYDWVYGSPTPIAVISKLQTLKGNPLFPASLIDAWSNAATVDVSAARRALQNARVDGAPLLTDVQDHADLSKPMSLTRQTLQALYQESYVQPGEEATASAPAGGPIDWNRERLFQVEEAVEAFATFSAPLDVMDAGADDIPPALRARIRQSAANHLVAHVSNLLRAAEHPMAGASDALELVSLESALPILVNVRESLSQAGATGMAGALGDRVTQRAGAVLAGIDRQLTEASPYRLADGLSLTPTDGLYAERAFRADSHDDLKASLVERRGQVAALAQKARPVVDYLLDPATRPPARVAALARRWRAISHALDGAAAGDANGSVLRLEQYILVDLDKVQPPDCPGYRGGAAGDYFSQQLQSLRLAVSDRCQGVAKDSLARDYADLAADFRVRFALAGHFPFGGSPAGVSAPLADPEAVRQFFAKWGPELASLSARLRGDPALGDAGPRAADFVAQLARVQLALAPMLAGAPDAPLAYRVNVQFFTDRTLAVAQDQVIEASIGAGDAPTASRADSLARPPWSFDWRNGQPINIVLRWAKDAATLPSATQSGPWPQASGDGVDARYRIEDNWALLRLISQAGGAAGRRGAGHGAILLQACLRPNPASARAPTATTLFDCGKNPARVYLQLSLATPVGAPGQADKSVPVSLPAFPTAAVDLADVTRTALATRSPEGER
jgi:type VI secretion system protein ImpL